MVNQREIAKSEIVAAVVRVAILLGLCMWVFWSDAIRLVPKVPKSSETLQILISPIAIILLLYLRRNVLARNLTNGSSWGILLIIGGLVMYAGARWPFSYGYARSIAMIPVLAGAVLVACGWRILKLTLPMVFLVLLSIPIGSRLYARLIIRPETYTIAATAITLDQLPGVDTTVKGIDLIFSSHKGSGVVGLGESNRGARLLFVFAAVGIFVSFSQVRSLWRVIVIVFTAVPIILFCNFLRLLCWGLVVIYTPVKPTSLIPRNISATCALLILYALFVLVCTVKLNLFIEAEEENIGSEKVDDE